MTWGDKIDGIVEKAVEEAVAEVLESKNAELKNKDIELKRQAEEIISLRKQLVESKNAK